jgi:hypothetical protein
MEAVDYEEVVWMTLTCSCCSAGAIQCSWLCS